MFVDTFVLISRRECFLVNFIMSLRNIACITMKGVFSLPSLFSYIVFNQGPVSSDITAKSHSSRSIPSIPLHGHVPGVQRDATVHTWFMWFATLKEACTPPV